MIALSCEQSSSSLRPLVAVKKKFKEKGTKGEEKTKDFPTKLCHSAMVCFLRTTFINYPLFVACQTLLVSPATVFALDFSSNRETYQLLARSCGTFFPGYDTECFRFVFSVAFLSDTPVNLSYNYLNKPLRHFSCLLGGYTEPIAYFTLFLNQVKDLCSLKINYLQLSIQEFVQENRFIQDVSRNWTKLCN